MSSYEFDQEALDEIDYWKDRATHWQERFENTYEMLTQLIELNELQVSQRVMDGAIEKIKEDLDG